MNELKSWTVYVKDKPDWQRIINHISPGKAKVEYWRELQDSWEIPYTLIRVKVNGLPHTSVQYKLMAQYRGIGFSYCGMQVSVSGEIGYIVGHNSSANMDVLFIAGKWQGQTLNCHPQADKVIFFDKAGKEIVIKQNEN